ncbi:MAG TPA: molybdopterin-dependent oxidoreductase [Candidatus Polarisedimenticolia bacterium]|nr:molybdopterin-dependent oxidoreductase [Candidatus Polarisedimenticolia bacterium]
MKRRTFLKLSAVGGAGSALAGCSNQAVQLIRFIPDETLIPGVATWKPGVCTQCSAGCGLQVRVMAGDAEVVRKGQSGIMRMGLAKKLAGNPDHPVNHGKLCVRGEAGLQVAYNPDRIRHPLKRAGQRGSGQFTQISWDEAMQELLTHVQPLSAPHATQSLAFLTRPLGGQRGVVVSRFLSGFDEARLVPFELFDDTVLRTANRLSFGYDQLPTFDLAHSSYVISFGADYLGTWNSPVAQNVAYGTLRQNRSGIRGKFVQVESRMSQTGANADEWVAAHPGTEGVLALAIAHVILKEHLGRAEAAGTAGTRIDGWREGLPEHSPDAIAWKTGVPPETITRLAREMAAQSPAVAVVGGAPLAHTNGLFTALAVNALNGLLGSVGKPGGLQFTPRVPAPNFGSAHEVTGAGKADSVRTLAQQILSGQPRPIDALLLFDANPVFATPPAWQVKEALEKVPFIASFGSFVDETSTLADLILPDHSYLESWIDEVPESGTTEAVISVAPPVMQPLHDTRALPDVLLDLAHRLGGRTGQALPWKSYEEMLQAALTPLVHRPGSISAKDADEFWKKIQEQGGWWSTGASAAPTRSPAEPSQPVKSQEPQFVGPAAEYPFYFLPYATQQFFDGRHANLPWMQEMPEVLSTGMWGTWVEINPRTAATLQIEQGDLLEVASPNGRVRAPALLSPGIAPDVIAMPVGQGHEDYGRYASNRGVNPITILAPQLEPATGSLAWAGTRVNITKAGKGELILLTGGPTQWGEEQVTR